MQHNQSIYVRLRDENFVQYFSIPEVDSQRASNARRRQILGHAFSRGRFELLTGEQLPNAKHSNAVVQQRVIGTTSLFDVNNSFTRQRRLTWTSRVTRSRLLIV